MIMLLGCKQPDKHLPSVELEFAWEMMMSIEKNSRLLFPGGFLFSLKGAKFSVLKNSFSSLLRAVKFREKLRLLTAIQLEN
jgi:hypothetical protein